jgi:CRISPR-associated protein Cmr5
MLTIEQESAQVAWICAKKAKESLKADKFEKYISLVKKLPTLIMVNGLGQSLAFLTAKAKLKYNKVNTDKEEGLLYSQVEQWLTRKSSQSYNEKLSHENENEPTKLLYRITFGTSIQYQQATNEALLFTKWLKSFADGLQEKEDKKEVTEEKGKVDEK